MIPLLGSAVFERVGDEVGRGGVVVDIGEEHVTVIEMWRGRPRYHHLHFQDIDPDLGDGLYINRAALRRLITELARDEVMSNRPLKHDQARRALAHVLASLGDPLMYRPGRA